MPRSFAANWNDFQFCAHKAGTTNVFMWRFTMYWDGMKDQPRIHAARYLWLVPYKHLNLGDVGQALLMDAASARGYIGAKIQVHSKIPPAVPLWLSRRFLAFYPNTGVGPFLSQSMLRIKQHVKKKRHTDALQ